MVSGSVGNIVVLTQGDHVNIAKRLKVSAEILLAITVIIMIIVAIKVISLGDPIRLQLLLSTIFFVLFMWLGWIQPKVTGIGLICLGAGWEFHQTI